MNPRTKESQHLRAALVESCNENDSMAKTIVSLNERLYIVQQERDEEKRRHNEEMHTKNDIIDERDKTIASQNHRLAIYSNEDSPSGKDPTEYESNKHFRHKVEANEEAKKNGESPPDNVTLIPCGGRPGHPGKSHSIKPSELRRYTGELCGGCGIVNSEMIKPINKLVQDEGRDGQPRDAYMAMVTFGWCDPCEDVTDPAPT